MADAEKQPLLAEPESRTIPIPSPFPSIRTRICATVIILIVLWYSVLTEPRYGFGRSSPPPRNGNWDINENLVPLEAHIMSKCPDARDCLRDLMVPVMQDASHMVNFTTSYIGSVNNETDEVTCKHGPAECLGNVIELCVADLYPNPKISLGFTNCMTMNYSRIPEREFVKSCAMEHGINFTKVNGCISDEGYGVGLLRDSMLRSQAANVIKSCTVRLNEDIYCIRDGGEWYDCANGSDPETLVAKITRLYKHINHIRSGEEEEEEVDEEI